MTNRIETSRKAIQAAINLRAAMNEIQQVAGEKLSGTSAVKFSERLLAAVAPLAPLAPKPFLLTTSKPQATYTKMPTGIHQVMRVLGESTMTITQIAAALKGERSLRYVADVLCRNSDGQGLNTFTRVRKGTYRIVLAQEKRGPKLTFRPKV